jgi:hypothetical protein
LIKKYGQGGTHVSEQQAARERLAMPRVVPDPGEPAYVPPAEPPAKTTAEAPEGATQLEEVKETQGETATVPE